MFEFLWKRFFVVRYNYTNPVDNQRANALLFINWATFSLWLFWLLLTWFIIVVVQEETWTNEAVVAFLPLPFIVVITFWMLQAGRLRFASWLFVGFLFLSVIVPNLDRLDQAAVILLALPLSAAGLLLGRRGVVITLLFIMFVVLIGGAAQSQLALPPSQSPADTLQLDMPIILTTLIFLATLLYIFGGNTQRLVRQSIDDLGTLQKIGRFTAQLPRNDVREIYAALLRLLVDNLRYDFAQLFITDAQGVIRQRVRIGLTRERSVVISDVTLDRANALYEAIQQKNPAFVTRNDPEARRTHLQYTMLFGLGVPMFAGDRLIGVIDVQRNSDSFSNVDAALLKMLAEQIATLLRDLETINSLRTNLSEQETTANNLRTRLNELQQQERQVMSSAWDVYLQQRGEEAIGFDFDPGMALHLPARDLPETLRPALTTEELKIEERDGERLITVPIHLHGNTLGAMAFSLPLDKHVTQRQLEMARKVADRLALALDNKRLFEQSQSQANRERKANEIANLLIGATDVDSVMSLAVNEFNNALGAIRTRIHIQPGALVARANTTLPAPTPAPPGGNQQNHTHNDDKNGGENRA